MKQGEANRLAVEAWWSTLARQGLRNVVVCPGSRSSALAIGAARNPSIRKHVCLDERSGAFFALGLAKASRRPSAIVCTSGTAAANFLPAVCEAKHAGVPLLVMTADRPPELQGGGAPQTMRQSGLYRGFVAAEYDLPVPGSTTVMSGVSPGVYEAFAKRSFHAALNGSSPVHVNFPFREPLLPDPETWPLESSKPMDDGGTNDRSAIQRSSSLLQKKLVAARNPILIAGPDAAHESERRAILRWAASWGITVFADVASGLRFGEPMNDDPRLPYYEAFLPPADVSLPQPDLILRAGAAPVSKRLNQWADSHAADVICIHPTGDIDPSNQFDCLLPGRLGDYTDSQKPVTVRVPKAFDDWRPFIETARRWRRLDETSPAHPEQALAATLRRSLPENSLVFLSSSMPIRDFDGLFWGDGELAVYANRGVNGIDGVVSTALGTAAGSGRRLTAIIGDVAFLHDANALSILADTRVAGVIVVVDNGGGKIFSDLPAGKYPEYERYFATPPRVDIAALAGAFGVTANVTESVEQTLQTVEAAHARPGLSLVCFKVPVTENKPRTNGWQALLTESSHALEGI